MLSINNLINNYLLINNLKLARYLKSNCKTDKRLSSFEVLEKDAFITRQNVNVGNTCGYDQYK